MEQYDEFGIVIPSELISVCLRGECVLYQGSWISASLGYPSWKETFRLILDAAARIYPDAVLEEVSAADDYDRVRLALSLAVERLGRERVTSVLRTILDLRLKKPPFDALVIGNVPFSAVIDGNWHNLTEVAFGERKPQILLPTDNAS